MTLRADRPPSEDQPRDVSVQERPRHWSRKLAGYFALTKSLQTLLLLATGVFSYMLSLQGHGSGWSVPVFGLALLLSISGCTALNMVIDRDVDALMSRTRSRPLPGGSLSLVEAIVFGALLSGMGLGLAFALRWQVGLIIGMGFVVDLGVYTLWMKRSSPLSIVFGGISGGMPALAGRVLAIGHIDLVGILFVLSILLWIPSHIVTLSIKYREDYRVANIPVWPNVYGEMTARRLIAIANLLNAGVLIAAGGLLGVNPVAMVLMAFSAAVMIALALWGLVRPAPRTTWTLFKAASIYMLLSFLLITFGVIF